MEDIFSQVGEIFSQVGEIFSQVGEIFSQAWERNCETRLAWMTSLQERLCFFRREERAVPSPKGLCHQNKLPLPISST